MAADAAPVGARRGGPVTGAPPPRRPGRARSGAGAAACRRLLATTLVVATAALLPACNTRRPTSPLVPAATLAWATTLGDAQRAAADGRFDDADRFLSGFATRYADSPEAAEARYWLALFKLDPANRQGSAHNAVADLDAYLAYSGALEHRTEGLALRRVAALVDTLWAAAQAPKIEPPSPSPADVAALRAKDDEIARLRDSLTKTSAELERVRKRLAPRP